MHKASQRYAMRYCTNLEHAWLENCLEYFALMHQIYQNHSRLMIPMTWNLAHYTGLAIHLRSHKGFALGLGAWERSRGEALRASKDSPDCSVIGCISPFRETRLGGKMLKVLLDHGRSLFFSFLVVEWMAFKWQSDACRQSDGSPLVHQSEFASVAAEWICIKSFDVGVWCFWETPAQNNIDSSCHERSWWYGGKKMITHIQMSERYFCIWLNWRDNCRDFQHVPDPPNNNLYYDDDTCTPTRNKDWLNINNQEIIEFNFSYMFYTSLWNIWLGK